MARLFSFPNPVNEKAARVVAGVVLITVLVILATGAYWLLIPLAYGFWARVLTGPTLSPLGWAAQNVIAPRLGPKKPVPGPPKRFAQGMGAAMATAALVLGLILGDDTAADVILGLFVIAAGLESIFAVCLGCQVFGCAHADRGHPRVGVRGVRRHQPAPPRHGLIAGARPLRPAKHDNGLGSPWPCRITRAIRAPHGTVRSNSLC